MTLIHQQDNLFFYKMKFLFISHLKWLYWDENIYKYIFIINFIEWLYFYEEVEIFSRYFRIFSKFLEILNQ